MRLPLDRRKQPEYRGAVVAAAFWKTSEPFVENRRGILIHRPRSVTLYNWENSLRRPHISVNYHCGNGAGDSKGDMTFLSDLPKGALLCEACEDRAVMKGLPSAGEIAGRHIHIGTLKAVQVCCNEVQT